MKRVALYGGSFDPFHLCHQLVIPYALSLTNADKLVIAPVHTHAFGKVMAPFHNRMEMATIGIKAFDHKSVYVHSIEKQIAEEKGVNLTIHTVERLLDGNRDTVILILGSDIIKDLHKWQRFEDLKALEEKGRLEFFFINRNGFDIDNGSRVRMPNISSTEVRAAIKAGRPISEMVPVSIAEYIKEKGLYL